MWISEPFLTDGTDNQPNVSGFQPLATQGGVIMVSVVNGQLIVEGSNDDDIVTITGIPPGVHGTGIYEITTQQGAQAPQTQIVSGVTSDILINLHAGNDQLTMNNAYVNGAIDIKMESGNDAVTLGNVDAVSTSTELRVDLGTENDTLNGKRIFIGTNQIIDGGEGDDQLVFDGIASPFTLGTSAGGNSVGPEAMETIRSMSSTPLS